MKSLKHIFVWFALTSCCQMSADECLRDDYFYFRVLSMTGEDLFTGSNPKYTVDDLKLYRVDNGTRVDLGNIVAEPGQLWTFVDYNDEVLIVEVQGQPKDTINVSFDIVDDKCCDDQSRIKTTTVDGQESDYSHSEGIDIKIVD